MDGNASGLDRRLVAADSSTLVVTLRSNAAGLLAGAPISALRRKLKLASLVYERVQLEAGTYRVQAGPQGSSSFWVPPSSGSDAPKWQRPQDRHQATKSGFSLSAAAEETPGRPASGPYVPLVSSATTISWEATLEPFSSEFDASCDWIEFVTAPKMPTELEHAMRQWNDLDKRNDILTEEFPDHFVRDRIIEDTNRDLALVVGAQAAMTADTVHGELLSARLEDDKGWHQQGFALPMLMPRAGDLAWSDIARLRSDNALDRLRNVWREVEQEALTEAARDGDVERAVRNAYDKKLRQVAADVDSVSGVAKDMAVGLILSAAGSAAGALLAGPAGFGVGLVGPTAISGSLSVRKALGRRRSRSWLALEARIADAAAP